MTHFDSLSFNNNALFIERGETDEKLSVKNLMTLPHTKIVKPDSETLLTDYTFSFNSV
jgi:hypothetical protein